MIEETQLEEISDEYQVSFVMDEGVRLNVDNQTFENQTYILSQTNDNDIHFSVNALKQYEIIQVTANGNEVPKDTSTADENDYILTNVSQDVVIEV